MEISVASTRGAAACAALVGLDAPCDALCSSSLQDGVVVAGWWEKTVVVFLDLAARATRRARAFTGGGWGWATSGNCETCLGAGIPRV